MTCDGWKTTGRRPERLKDDRKKTRTATEINRKATGRRLECDRSAWMTTVRRPKCDRNVAGRRLGRRPEADRSAWMTTRRRLECDWKTTGGRPEGDWKPTGRRLEDG